jgi:hypothetical protein
MKFLFTCITLLGALAVSAQDEKTNEAVKDSVKINTELNEVVLEKKKQAVERKADRTIFDFSEQAHLNSGSLMEGLKKLPGLIVSEVAGMMYQGKQLQVYMDGRPLNIYSNELTSYLEGMPANSIEKVEVITNPGAEFPATSGGAIINIITSKKVKKYFTATYSNGYSYTKYDTGRHKFNNSMTISAANKLFSWQVQGGQSYSEGYRRNNFYNDAIILSNNITDRVNRFYYLKTGLKFDFKKDRLLVNYDLNSSNNDAYIGAYGEGFVSDDQSKTKWNYHDVMLTYQKRFDDMAKKLDFRFNFNNSTNDFDQLSRLTGVNVLGNENKQGFYQFKTDYTQEIKFLDKTKISMGVLADLLDFKATNLGITNLDYRRTSTAGYAEGQITYKKFELIAGGRLETYNIEGSTPSGDLLPFHKTRFFPNATLQYNIIDNVYAKVNYNNKISLPDTGSLNPNNTNYQNPNVGFFGNPNLEPTFFHNYEVEVNAFQYFNIGFSLTDAKNQIINRIITTPDGAASVTENVPNITMRNFNFGIPLPYMLFTQGLKKVLEMNFNPDEINFMYIYAGNQKHIIPGLDTKSIWSYNLMSQILLPKKIKFTANYNTSNRGGNYYYYVSRAPFNQQLDVTFSKKFLSDNLSASIYANDILNTNKQYLRMAGTNLYYNSKYDSRRVGISLNYKIPTKGKPERENNLLNNNNPQQQQNSIGN